jgi:type II secretory pathway component GspD/PulD (secretin)
VPHAPGQGTPKGRLAYPPEPTSGDPGPATRLFPPSPERPVQAQFNLLDRLKSPLAAPAPPPSPTPVPPGAVTLHLDDVDVRKALEMLSRQGRLSMMISPGVAGRVTADLRGLPYEEAFGAILKLCNLVGIRKGPVVYVYAPQEVPLEDRTLHTYSLDFVAAADVLAGVQGLLSPVGHAFVNESSSTDNRRTQDSIAVEDLPEHLTRIEQYLCQIDRPPRQVMIQVHVLQVDLDADKAHGVNFNYFFDLLNTRVDLTLHGLANPAAPQAFFVTLNGTSIEALIECLKTTTDAKTLASPRVMVLNGQEARIQIGEQLGYRVTRVTETAAIEDVEFLDLGVVLDVTPRISRCGQVMMRVKPEVSSGNVNPDTELPEEETTSIDTDVLLSSGRGMIIGGLIQEKDSNIQSKILGLGDLFLAGLLFQRRHIEKTRSEIIIALTPYVLPYPEEYAIRDEVETDRAGSPLFQGPLDRYPRPWEPMLPDACRNPTRLFVPGLYGGVPGLHGGARRRPASGFQEDFADAPSGHGDPGYTLEVPMGPVQSEPLGGP